MSETKAATGSAVITSPVAHRGTTAKTSQEAFSHFYREHYRSLLKAVLYLGATWSESEDAVTAAMRDVWVNWPEIEHPLGWARRAAVNHFVKERQRGRRRREMEADPKAPRPPAVGGEAALTLREDSEWVVQLLDKLPPAQREAMALLVDGHSQSEIADILGKTPAAVRQNLATARRSLKRKVPTSPPLKAPESNSTTAGSEVR